MSKPQLNVAFLTGDMGLNVSLAAALAPPSLSTRAGPPDMPSEELAAMYAAGYGGDPAPSYSEFETAARRYTAVEFGPYEKPRRMLLNAAPCLDAAVLTVFASEGLGVVTREHVLLLREAGVRHVAVFVDTSNVVGEPEMIDLTEHEARALLAEYGFPADDLPAVRGDLLAVARGEDADARRCLDELRSALDLLVPAPDCERHGPFLLSIDGVRPGRRGTTAISGWAERARVHPGDVLDCVGGNDQPLRIAVEEVRRLTARVHSGGARLRLTVAVRACRDELQQAAVPRRRGGEGHMIHPGRVLASPGSVRVSTRFDADCYLATPREGGREHSLGDGEQIQFLLRSAEAPGVVRLSEGQREVWPGRRFCVRVELPADCATVMGPGLRFAFRGEEGLSGYGVVEKVYR
jgi:elongation factor Tu